MENLYNCMYDYCKKLKTLWQKEKLLVLSIFSFCQDVFQKTSAAEASESIYMSETVKSYNIITHYNDIQSLTKNILVTVYTELIRPT